MKIEVSTAEIDPPPKGKGYQICLEWVSDDFRL